MTEEALKLLRMIQGEEGLASEFKWLAFKVVISSLTDVERRIIAYIQENPGSTVKAIEEGTGIQRANAGKAVNGLEEFGLIESNQVPVAGLEGRPANHYQVVKL